MTRWGALASLLFDGCDRHCGDAFAAADRPEAFIGRCLDADARFIRADRIRDFFKHRKNVRRDLRCFRDDRCIDIHDARFFPGEERGHAFQNVDAADAAN